MARCEQCNLDLPESSERCPQCGGALEPDELLGREVLGRYRIVRLLAEGGMGRVYLAEQSVGTVVRRVAIKVLRRQLGNDRQLVSRFSREAETLVRLTHPNTVQLFDFGALPDGTLGLVMEYVEGHSLATELLRGALPPHRVERLLTQACGALQEAHAHGIVHRDLKPDNMLIAERVGHGDFVKVLDFGIAKVSTEQEAAAGTKLTQQGMIIGTPPYMSPEQFSGEPVDARSDIYSLGVIAYEMLTAKLPFAAKTPWEWASRHLTAQPDALPLDASLGLLPRHALAIRDALAKRPDDRPQTVAAFLARFTADGQASSALTNPGAALDQRAREPSGTAAGTSAATLSATLSAQLRRPWFKPAVGLAALVLVVVLGYSRLHANPAAATQGPKNLAVAEAKTSLMAPLKPASEPLPSGVGLPPDEPRGASESTHGKHHEHPGAESSGRSHERRSAHAATTPADPAPLAATLRSREEEPRASIPSTPPEARVPPAAAAQAEPRMQPAPARPDPVSRPSASTAPAASSGASTPRRAISVPDDLAQRILLIQSTAATRVEQAVGLFQAAASRYGAHPALQAPRNQLATNGEMRIKELIVGGRCAQAQALFRALRAIDASAKANGAFGPQCPAPR